MPRESNTTRERLIATAIDLIWSSSYGATSVGEICKRAGAQKGSFYHFFPSKSDLTVAAIQAQYAIGHGYFHQAFAAPLPPLERLARFADLMIAKQEEQAARYGKVCGCPFASIGSELAMQDEPVRAAVAAIVSKWHTSLADCLADAVRTGDLPPTDIQSKATALVHLIMGVLTTAKIHNDLNVLRRDLWPGMQSVIGAGEGKRAA